MRPVSSGVRTQPAGSRTVAGFAAYAVIELKSLRTLISSNEKRVTDQTLRRSIWRSDIKDSSNARGNRIAQHVKSSCVLVLANPDTVLVLRNASHRPGLYAPVAAAGRASARAGILAWANVLLRVERFSIRRRGNRRTWWRYLFVAFGWHARYCF